MAHDRCKPLQGSSACRWSGGRQSGHEPHKRGLTTKIHLAVDAHGMPLRAVITEGTRADCKEACAVIDGFTAEALLADRAFDTDAVVEAAIQRGMKVVIPPKKSRKKKREYDRYLYKARHLVENAFFTSQKVAWNCDPLCKKKRFFSCCRPNQMHLVMAAII